MALPSHPNLLVGADSLDDAGVYRLTDDLALVLTVDFFTPVVDDPYDYGRIAAANSLSDVYAMGGVPIAAMNVVGFPSDALPLPVLGDILRGGAEVAREAGVTIVGGHSIQDAETKYGLSVTGTVHPDRIVTNAGARPGDALVLTKPLGTGVIGTALKGGMADEDAARAAVETMVALNRAASELMVEAGASACTDVTGFGLLGHACEMALASEVALTVDHAAVPLLPRAVEYAGNGLVPAGTYANRDHRASMVSFKEGLPEWTEPVLFDPQTSGGLLITLPSSDAPSLVEKLRAAGIDHAAVIGRVEQAGAPCVKVG